LFVVCVNQVNNVTPSQAGRYSCVITNEHGTAETSASLTILRNKQEGKSSLTWQTGFDSNFAKISEIARGRFSIVRRSIDMRSGAELAAKCISKSLTSRDRVQSEVDLMSDLHHQGFIIPRELYETSMAYVIILPILLHGRLFEYLCTKTHFDETFAAGFVHQLLEALQYLHSRGIAHLDVKPENLLLDLSGTSRCLKLIDFGDAQRISSTSHSCSVVVRGSPEFVAPELISGQRVAISADVWSVGVVVYVLLSGVSPFLDDSLTETCSNVVRRDFSFPDEYFTVVSSSAKDFISSCLVLDPSIRPPVSRCLQHDWLLRSGSVKRNNQNEQNSLSTKRLIDFIERRRHQNDITVVKYSS